MARIRRLPELSPSARKALYSSSPSSSSSSLPFPATSNSSSSPRHQTDPFRANTIVVAPRFKPPQPGDGPMARTTSPNGNSESTGTRRSRIEVVIEMRPRAPAETEPSHGRKRSRSTMEAGDQDEKAQEETAQPGKSPDANETAPVKTSGTEASEKSTPANTPPDEQQLIEEARITAYSELRQLLMESEIMKEQLAALLSKMKPENLADLTILQDSADSDAPPPTRRRTKRAKKKPESIRNAFFSVLTEEWGRDVEQTSHDSQWTLEELYKWRKEYQTETT
ncbi:hypothetical protein EX30DRAFT_364314 [Ascodesmis nigricans]|uniref:Uncharacterized protein n=1 Tax=Ascodesmis nigricans TaxID=341454 RepID=A0A4S2MVL8_9PEZI|nr:hypothetical protein EX30DRAFT_364314 [Ascodesmis nigricans]